MAGEFRIKTGLLLGANPTQPVISIQDTSVSITTDASSILVTGKAIFDFVNSQSGSSTLEELSDVSVVSLADKDFLQYEASTGKWINITPIETSLNFLKESSIGTGFAWNAGLLDVSSAGVSYLSSLLDVSIVDASDFNMLSYDAASSKWINIAPVEASSLFWELSIPLLRESSIGSGLVWNAGLLDVSASSVSDASINFLYDWNTSQDASIDSLWTKFDNVDTSLNSIWTKFGYIDTSIDSIWTKFDNVDTSFGLFATNASVGIALGEFIKSSSTGTGLYWNAGLLDVSVSGGGTGLTPVEVSSNYTALSNSLILVDTSNNSVDITLPLSPANGDIVQIIDIVKNASTNNINVLRNGHLLDRTAANFAIDINGGSIELVYHELEDNFAFLAIETLRGFEDDSGYVTQSNLDASLAAIDNSIAELYSIALDSSITRIGNQDTDGSWRLVIDASGNLSVQKRITGSWVEKGNFS